MKKLVLLALFALSFLASTSRAIGPLPTCDPCPWVR